MQKFLFLLCFLVFKINAQNYKIVYFKKVNLSNGNTSTLFNKECTLLFDQNYSLFSTYNIDTINSKKIKDRNGNDVRVISNNDTIHAFKNKKDSTIVVKKQFFTSKKIVLDSLGVINWELIDEKKIILGYDCFKAKTKFRGREFEVFYTTKIPISDGPDHFYGLPGVILSVKLINSIDTYEIEAFSIQNSNEIISNPYLNIASISFVEFKKLYKKKYEELGNYSGGENLLSKGGLENLIDE